jgi:hypothetical protein
MSRGKILNYHFVIIVFVYGNNCWHSKETRSPCCANVGIVGGTFDGFALVFDIEHRRMDPLKATIMSPFQNF